LPLELKNASQACQKDGGGLQLVTGMIKGSNAYLSVSDIGQHCLSI